MNEASAEMRLLLMGARFITEHPYASTGLLGAAVGSFLTYTLMSDESRPKVVPGAVYEVEIPPEHLEDLIEDPTIQLRYNLPLITVIITGEKRQPLKELPDIEVTPK